MTSQKPVSLTASLAVNLNSLCTKQDWECLWTTSWHWGKAVERRQSHSLVLHAISGSKHINCHKEIKTAYAYSWKCVTYIQNSRGHELPHGLCKKWPQGTSHKTLAWASHAIL